MHARQHVVVVLIKTNDGGTWIMPQVAALASRGHRVVVVLPAGDGRLRRLLDEHGVECVDSAFSFRFRPSLSTVTGLVRLRRQLRALAPSVLVYHLIASALAGRLATLGTRLPRVHMVPGPLYLESAPIRWAERLLCRLDAVVIGGSAYTADRYRELGLSAERLIAIPYGVDVTKVSPDAVHEAAGPVDPDTFQVVMVAFVYAPKRAVHAGVGIKGHDILLDAWARFEQGRDDVRLVMVGGGFDDPGAAYRDVLVDRSQERGLRCVEWVGTVTDARPHYKGADLSVSPSLSENHGAALEASAMAVPSIVSDAGALPETVIQGTSGWVVPRGDSDALFSALGLAYQVWKDGGLGDMGEAARRHVVSGFEQSRCAAEVADVVEQIMKTRP